jgi:Zn-dependent peptidase ImmA (M78 family)
MLREILANTLISPETVARLLGINTEIFLEWVANQRPIPNSVLEMLSGVIGVDLAPYLERKVPVQEAAAITPAIWYRFRQSSLTPEDREFVFLVRRLGSHINELEEATGAKAVGWKTLFQEIRQKVDTQAPPRVQGIEAANMFRESRDLSRGSTGIGEVLRGNLRSMGVLVVEGSLPKSRLEGCCFYVGNRPHERPCVFANSYQSTWFRRNLIILHEVAHAIFDAESAGAALDFYDGDTDKLAEERADAFAQQVLVPRTVLHHITQRSGIKWEALSPNNLAKLVAETHAEKRTILRSAFESGLISQSLLDQYLDFDIAAILPGISYHALSTDEYIKVCGVNSDDWKGKRNTTIPSRTIRLPPAYIKGVIEAVKNGSISRGKAAAMLMIDERDFEERFGGGQEEDDVDDMQAPLALA